MEQLFEIESAGYNLHYFGVNPKVRQLEDVSYETRSLRRTKSYYRLLGELMCMPSTSKKKSCELGSQIIKLEQKYQSLPISIPNCNLHLYFGQQQIDFNIFMAGLKVTTRTYQEFKNLHTNIVSAFYNERKGLPQLPTNMTHFSSVKEIEDHRQQLEKYLYQICRVKVIAESDHVQNFLSAVPILAEAASATSNNANDGIKLTERIFLKCPISRPEDNQSYAVDGEKQMDLIEQIIHFAETGSSTSFVDV